MMIRFPEKKMQNISEVIQNWLIEETGMEQEIITGGIETVFRQASSNARRNYLPREIIIKFTK